jgi:hypothetical protein
MKLTIGKFCKAICAIGKYIPVVKRYVKVAEQTNKVVDKIGDFSRKELREAIENSAMPPEDKTAALAEMKRQGLIVLLFALMLCAGCLSTTANQLESRGVPVPWYKHIWYGACEAGAHTDNAKDKVADTPIIP